MVSPLEQCFTLTHTLRFIPRNRVQILANITVVSRLWRQVMIAIIEESNLPWIFTIREAVNVARWFEKSQEVVDKTLRSAHVKQMQDSHDRNFGALACFETTPSSSSPPSPGTSLTLLDAFKTICIVRRDFNSVAVCPACRRPYQRLEGQHQKYMRHNYIQQALTCFSSLTKVLIVNDVLPISYEEQHFFTNHKDNLDHGKLQPTIADHFRMFVDPVRLPTLRQVILHVQSGKILGVDAKEVFYTDADKCVECSAEMKHGHGAPNQCDDACDLRQYSSVEEARYWRELDDRTRFAYPCVDEMWLYHQKLKVECFEGTQGSTSLRWLPCNFKVAITFAVHARPIIFHCESTAILCTKLQALFEGTMLYEVRNTAHSYVSSRAPSNSDERRADLYADNSETYRSVESQVSTRPSITSMIVVNMQTNLCTTFSSLRSEMEIKEEEDKEEGNFVAIKEQIQNLSSYLMRRDDLRAKEEVQRMLSPIQERVFLPMADRRIVAKMCTSPVESKNLASTSPIDRTFGRVILAYFSTRAPLT